MVVHVQIDGLKRRLLALTAGSLMIAGAGFLVIWASALADGALYQVFQQAQFNKQISDESGRPQTRSAAPAAPIEPVSMEDKSLWAFRTLPRPSFPDLFRPDPQLIGRLEAPAIHLSVMIREGVDDKTLRRAAGHLPSSALPGQAGDFVLLGHRDTFFRALRDVQRGDALRIQTRGGQFTYVVDSLEVTGPDSIRIEPNKEPSATLITCFPFTYIGPAPRRLVVHARLKTGE